MNTDVEAGENFLYQTSVSIGDHLWFWFLFDWKSKEHIRIVQRKVKPETIEILSEIFQSNGRSVNLRKREIFAKQGMPLQSVGLVSRGSFKLVYKRDKKEWIKSFVFAGGLLGSIPSLLQKKPSSYSIQAMEQSEVWVLPAQELTNGLSSLKLYESTMIDFLSALYLKKEERVADFLLLEPEERYRKFINEYATHLDQISQIDQAAYLGMTNVSLSRIKARVFPSLR